MAESEQHIVRDPEPQLYNDDEHESSNIEPPFSSAVARGSKLDSARKEPYLIGKQPSVITTTSATCPSTDECPTSSESANGVNKSTENDLPRYHNQFKGNEDSNEQVEYSIAEFFKCRVNNNFSDQEEEPYIEELGEDSSDDEFEKDHNYEEDDDSVVNLNPLGNEEDDFVAENCKLAAPKMGCLGLFRLGLSGYYREDEEEEAENDFHANERIPEPSSIYDGRIKFCGKTEPEPVVNEISFHFEEDEESCVSVVTGDSTIYGDEDSHYYNTDERWMDSDTERSFGSRPEPVGEKFGTNEISITEGSSTKNANVVAGIDLSEAEPVLFDPYMYRVDDDVDDDRHKLQQVAVVIANESVSSDWSSDGSKSEREQEEGSQAASNAAAFDVTVSNTTGSICMSSSKSQELAVVTATESVSSDWSSDGSNKSEHEKAEDWQSASDAAAFDVTVSNTTGSICMSSSKSQERAVVTATESVSSDWSSDISKSEHEQDEDDSHAAFDAAAFDITASNTTSSICVSSSELQELAVVTATESVSSDWSSDISNKSEHEQDEDDSHAAFDAAASVCMSSSSEMPYDEMNSLLRTKPNPGGEATPASPVLSNDANLLNAMQPFKAMGQDNAEPCVASTCSSSSSTPIRSNADLNAMEQQENEDPEEGVSSTCSSSSLTPIRSNADLKVIQQQENGEPRDVASTTTCSSSSTPIVLSNADFLKAIRRENGVEEERDHPYSRIEAC